jgi:hypothetical protein
MSFQTLSKRDTLQSIFEEMGNNMTSMDSNYTDATLQANFILSNIHPRPHYNDHEQKDIYIDQYTANVSMGVLAVSSFFNYSIVYADRNKTGVFRVRGFPDPSYFTKKLILTEGYLEWKPESVPAFTFSADFHFEYASPNVTEAEMNIILKMLNNQAGSRRVKDQALIEMNTKFGPLLTKMLNHEDLVSSTNITYKYGNLTFQLANYAKDFGLYNGQTKGLEVHLLFGLDNYTENCTVLPNEFDEDQYGGLQEVYSFGIVRSLVKEALLKGFFDRVLDKSWDVPGFQFYMGDLGNFVEYANNAPSSDPFTATCKFNQSRMEKELKISPYDEHRIYLGIPYSCRVNYKEKDILTLEMDLTMIARLVLRLRHSMERKRA